jgi:hypothetical protein
MSSVGSMNQGPQESVAPSIRPDTRMRSRGGLAMATYSVRRQPGLAVCRWWASRRAEPAPRRAQARREDRGRSVVRLPHAAAHVGHLAVPPSPERNAGAAVARPPLSAGLGGSRSHLIPTRGLRAGGWVSASQSQSASPADAGREAVRPLIICSSLVRIQPPPLVPQPRTALHRQRFDSRDTTPATLPRRHRGDHHPR